MRSCLEGAEDPNDTAVERCLPGVNKRFEAAQHQARQMHTEIKEVKGIVQGMQKEQKGMRDGFVGGLEMLLGNMKRSANEGGSGKDGGGGRKRSRIDDNDGVPEHLQNWPFDTRKPENVREIYDEWKGLGKYVGQPIDGGIEALELTTNKKWRKGYQGADQKHFSRVVQLMGAIDGELTKDRSIDDVMREYEGIFGEKKKSLSALVVELQSRGLIDKKVRNLRQSP